MTQKEYKEKLLNLKNENEELKKKLDFERNKSYNYEQVLIDYHRINEEFIREKESNRQNVFTIDRLNKTIEQYEKILNKFTINFQ